MKFILVSTVLALAFAQNDTNYEAYKRHYDSQVDALSAAIPFFDALQPKNHVQMHGQWQSLDSFHPFIVNSGDAAMIF